VDLQILRFYVEAHQNDFVEIVIFVVDVIFFGNDVFFLGFFVAFSRFVFDERAQNAVFFLSVEA
jgi:hypothetical protein